MKRLLRFFIIIFLASQPVYAVKMVPESIFENNKKNNQHINNLHSRCLKNISAEQYLEKPKFKKSVTSKLDILELLNFKMSK